MQSAFRLCPPSPYETAIGAAILGDQADAANSDHWQHGAMPAVISFTVTAVLATNLLAVAVGVRFGVLASAPA